MMPGFGTNGWCGFGSLGGLSGLGWIGMILNLVLTIGFVVAVIWLVVWAVRRFTTTARPGQVENNPSARDLLQIRYVRGEINREQYQQMLSDLS
jgi:putative membrane protein